MTVNYEKLRKLQQYLRQSYREDVEKRQAMGESHTRKIEVLDLIFLQQTKPNADTEQRLEQMLKDYGHAHWGVFR